MNHIKIVSRLCLFIICALVFTTNITAASDSIYLNYDGLELKQVLTDLEEKHQVTFSYSHNKIPLEQKIYAAIQVQSIEEALNEIFAQTQIVFELIGEQIVLAFDQNKVPVTPDMGYEESKKNNSYHVPIVKEVRLVVQPAPYIRAGGMNIKPVKDPSYVERLSGKPLPLDFSHVYADENASKEGPHLHASLVYPFGIHSTRDETEPTNLGMHLTVGVDEFLEGIQFSVLGGAVLNEMEGAQISGLFNGVLGKCHGAQLAGIANFAKEEMNGFQGAGIVNTSFGGNNLVQVGGISNVALGESDFQVAGIANVGHHVKKGQISGIINIARKVDGFQIGLINIADTINGPAIGLFSFARNGYHSFELSGQESLHANMIFRLGTRPFYNIFRLGSRVDERTWGLGYGIGTSLKIGKKHFLQAEVMTTHVNQNEWWTNQLNLLNQFNVNINFKLGKHFGIAIGPTFNIAVSQVYNEDTNQYGMNLGQNYFLDRTSFSSNGNPVNVKGWIGLHAGIRFESN